MFSTENYFEKYTAPLILKECFKRVWVEISRRNDSFLFLPAFGISLLAKRQVMVKGFNLGGINKCIRTAFINL